MKDVAPNQETLIKIQRLSESLKMHIQEFSELSTQLKEYSNKSHLSDDEQNFITAQKSSEAPLSKMIKIETLMLNTMLEDLYEQYLDHEFIKYHYSEILYRRAVDTFKLEGSEEQNLKALKLAHKAYDVYPTPKPTILTSFLNIIAANLLKPFPNTDAPTIEKAIEYYKKSLQLIPDQEKLTPPFHVKTPLSIAYNLLFQKLDESMVDKRIDCLRAAAEYAPRTSHGRDRLSTLYAFLTNTAQDLQAQHNNTKAIELLEEAYEKYTLHLTFYPDITNFQEGMHICKLLATSYEAIGNHKMAAKYSEKSKHSTIDLSKFTNSAYSGITLNISNT